ncbi:Cytochrome P450 monooxygenase [Pseudocercospora fuligena]|uniref:Cytochrome P450 monooxygenase n=1 Tax=Pseudocercospora fuligena TaxID=685502 RepID=A0A8H6VMD6_9PEZI|nr:Cytochrome P450 monooxygenase [Pseudocercospora fuligena]
MPWDFARARQYTRAYICDPNSCFSCTTTESPHEHFHAANHFSGEFSCCRQAQVTQARLNETMEALPMVSDQAALTLQATLGAVVLGIIWIFIVSDRPYSGIPLIQLGVDSKGWWRRFLGGPGKKEEFMYDSAKILEKGKQVTNGQVPFQVKTGSGYQVFLPNRYAEEFKSHPDLDFYEAQRRIFNTDHHGFDGLREGISPDQLMVDVIRQKLTQSLNLVTGDLIDETDHAVTLHLGHDSEWQTHRMKDVLLDMVARISTRIFAGIELCRHPEWLVVTKQYTTQTFLAGQALHRYPTILRPFVQWWLPECVELRREAKLARKIVGPVFARKLEERQAQASSDHKQKTTDSLTMMLDVAERRGIANYDAAAGQLLLSIAAIHSTTETVGRCLIRLCQYPDVVQPLRDEIITILKEEGWAKTTLYKLGLLDSFIKEVSRHFTFSNIAMGRVAKKRITFSDGTTIPKGSMVQVLNDGLWDSDFYENPKKFDPWRYLKMRERAGEHNKHQFVTTSADNMYFGHGKYACPGRFFAGNEIKIMLCMFLLRYDFRIQPSTTLPESLEFESIITLHPDFELQARRRKEEIDVVSPKRS